MGAITYVTGDATQPVGSGRKIIAHVCNDAAAWGAGFVLAVSRRWPEPELQYRNSAALDRMLGTIQPVEVGSGLLVVNMIAQSGIGCRRGRQPIRYAALATCLDKLANFVRILPATVHMPRIGCGLAGGNWSFVAALIEETLCDNGVPVTVYDLPK